MKKKIWSITICILLVLIVPFGAYAEMDGDLNHQLKIMAKIWLNVIVPDNCDFYEASDYSTTNAVNGNEKRYLCSFFDESSNKNIILFARVLDDEISLENVLSVKDEDSIGKMNINVENANECFLSICKLNSQFGDKGDITHEQYLDSCEYELFSPVQLDCYYYNLWQCVLKLDSSNCRQVELLWDPNEMVIRRVTLR